MRGEWLERIGGFGIVVLEKEISYAVVQSIIYTTLALKGISFAQCAGFEKKLYHFVVAAETGLQQVSVLFTDSILGLATRMSGV